jgi:hypothetical protein
MRHTATDSYRIPTCFPEWGYYSTGGLSLQGDNVRDSYPFPEQRKGEINEYSLFTS